MRRRHLLAALPLFATGLIKASAARAAPVLRVGAALPDPPFEFTANDGPAGFDITLMQRIAGMIGREWQLVPYKGRGQGLEFTSGAPIKSGISRISIGLT